MRKTWLRGLGLLALLVAMAVAAGLVAHREPFATAGPQPAGSAPVAAATEPPGGPLPPCAGAPVAVARPARLPVRFPLPPGTVLTGQEERPQGLVVTGLVPATAHTVALYFNRALPAGGFRQALGESESNEAESDYAGNGVQGRWKIRDLAGCAGGATLTLLVLR